MKFLSRIFLRVLSRTARPFLKSYGLLSVKKIFNRSALEWTPAAGRIAVLAPHMDDEVIGCGGTLALHVAAGADVTVVFLTDGSQGRAGSRSSEAVRLTAVRKQEAQRALRELGVTKLVFLDGEDGALATGAERAVVDGLRDALAAARPDIVYLPFFLEEHPDHRAASVLLGRAVSGTTLSFQCHAYEVWTPLFPNCLVRIDTSIDAKRRALEHYQSQLAEADYLHTAIGLNAYRSSALLDGSCRFAEAFFAASLPQYLRLLEAYGDAS